MAKIETITERENNRMRCVTTEPLWVRVALITVSIAFLTIFLLLPLLTIFTMAFSDGIVEFWKVLTHPHTLHAIGITLLTIVVVVPVNILFGVAMAWCLGKFEFRGKGILLTLLDVPFAISPVIAGLLFVFILGRQSMLGGWLMANDIRILYAFPGIVIATLFVTLPFVARELLPIMEAQGTEEELAARVLGARGFQIFWRVTLPNIKWGLLYGAILCNARAMGEFGAVFVMSNSTPGLNSTLTLYINTLYHNPIPACAPYVLASLLALLALVTLVVKAIFEKTTSTLSK